ncbi:MAG TPA: hypothetical protein PKE26_06815 [Kiritimatiellia bacterium]|nr:hypothetical protein [Kiritimatiellia bacterium]HMO98802.1 hypothetical protein [Kiritimatiellia bacterium]
MKIALRMATATTLVVAGIVATPVVYGQATSPSAVSLPPPGRWAPITSHRHHVTVVDFPPRDALEIALWAETVWERLEQWAGRRLPETRGFPVIISARLDDESGISRVVLAQELDAEGVLRQELTMIQPAGVDQEDVLEGLCRLLMNRWLAPRARELGRNDFGDALPAWWVIGAAQQLFPELRERNLRMIREADARGETEPITALFRAQVLPPGRWLEKARADLAVAWLIDREPAREWVTRIMERALAGVPVDAAWLVEIGFAESPRALEAGWDLWLARQDGKMIPGVFSRDTARLLRLLALRAEDYGVILSDGRRTGSLAIETLIADREAPWVAALVRRITGRISQEVVGKAPDIAEAIRPFQDVLAAIAAPPPHPRRQAGELAARWRTAWQQLDRLVSVETERRRLLDAVASGEAEQRRELESLLRRWEAAPPPE